MIKDRLLVLIDAVFNCIVISVITIAGKDYIKNNLNNLDFPSNYEISKIYVTVNILYIVFLMIVCVILNYIQYIKKEHELSNPWQYLIINTLISIVPFTIPILFPI